jgi:Protein of unknown function (DUF1552)
MNKLLRRDMLRMLGLTGAAALAPDLVRALSSSNTEALAGPLNIPRRIVFFYTEHGTLQQTYDEGGKNVYKNFYLPDVPGAPAATTITSPWSTTAHTLSEIHQPLEPWKKDLLLVHGLDMVSGFIDPLAPGNGHYAGATHAMTAVNRATPSLAGGISIDQFIAKAINSPKPQTLLPSLDLYVSEDGGDAGGESAALYSGSGQPLLCSGNVLAAYDRLFPGGSQATAAEEAARARALLRKKKVLDSLRKQYETSGNRSSKVDRERLLAHSAALGDLRDRIDLTGVTCAPLEKKTFMGMPERGAARYSFLADSMMRLTQTALACDLTRVATIYMGQPADALVGYRSIQGTDSLHDLIHKTHGGNAALRKDADGMKIATDYHKYHAAQFAKLLGLLKAIPERDGGTLLDHTLVVWCGQLANGDHTLNYIPYVLGGKMGGAVTPGRYVRYPRKPQDGATPYGWNVDGTVGLPHNMLFVALAQAMGVSASTFGNPTLCTQGPLKGLT